MDFEFTPEQLEFVKDVEAFLDEHDDPEIFDVTRENMAQIVDTPRRREFMAELSKKGWLGITWPEEYGGQDGDGVYEYLLNEALAARGGPQIGKGVGIIGKTLITHGSQKLKDEFLPQILNAEIEFAVGYSEPNAGSDAASMQLKATKDGDGWRLNGQKTWTTSAHFADWYWVGARTDPEAPKHHGISLFMVRLDHPGITVKAIWTMGDERTNEVYFDEARTSADLVLGDVNDGWKVAMATLGFERGTAFLSQQLAFQRELAEIIGIAQDNGSSREATIRQELADSYIGVQIMKFNGMRMLTDLVKRGVLGPSSSIGKLFWSNWHRTLGERAMDVLGTDGLLVADEGAGRYELDELHQIFMTSRAETIYAGASEIQRNIIGERVLGLPREPR